MSFFSTLINDESGSVLSAEAVVVGTVVLIGATAGLGAASKSIDAELYELASAIRHLDQSYSVQRAELNGDWSAGSSYTQPDLQESLRELDREYREHQQADRERAEELRRQHIQELAPDREQDDREKDVPQIELRLPERDQSREFDRRPHNDFNND